VGFELGLLVFITVGFLVRLMAGVCIGTTPALDDSESREQGDSVQALVMTGQFRYSIMSSPSG
jgi:hypothetical protein